MGPRAWRHLTLVMDEADDAVRFYLDGAELITFDKYYTDIFPFAVTGHSALHKESQTFV